MKALTIASTKGGVGKSTAAFHLAYYFSGFGDVALVDADPNHSATNWVDRSPVDVPFKVFSLDDAANVQADLLILDSQISINEVRAIAKDSDLILIPTTTSALAVEAAMKLADLIPGKYRIMFNLIDPRAKRTATKAAESLRELDYELLSTWVRSYSVYEQAALKGLPVSKVSGKGGIAWSDYKTLGEEVREILSNV